MDKDPHPGPLPMGEGAEPLGCSVPDFVPAMVVGALCGLVLLAGLLAVLARVF